MSDGFGDSELTVADLLGAAGRHGLALTSSQDALDTTGLDFVVLIEHARERWATFPATAAEYGLRTGNEAVLTYARTQMAGLESG